MDIFWLTNGGQLLGKPHIYLIAAVGAVIGSFLNVCIIRIPIKSFLKSARSRCPHCDKIIPFWFNIPVLSFLFLKGQAHCCKQKISWQYPIIEILTATGFFILYFKFPFLVSYGNYEALDIGELRRFLHASVFLALIIICSAIDFKFKIIPDAISLPMIALSPLIVWLQPDLTLRSSLLGVFIGGGSVYLIAWVYYLIRKEEGIGMGDAKLLAAFGGWLGFESIFPIFFYGSLIGSAFGITIMILRKTLSSRIELPFGPFLSIGAFIHLLFGTQLIVWIIGRG